MAADQYGCGLIFLRILNNVTATLYFFINVFTISKIFKVLTCINTNLEVTVNWLQSSQVCEQRHMLRMIVTPREILCFPRYGVSVSVSDLWRGMASRKSHVSELKNWMPMHSKKKSQVLGQSSELVETLIGLRSQGGVPVTQGSGLKKKKKNAQASGFSQGSFVDSIA